MEPLIFIRNYDRQQNHCTGAGGQGGDDVRVADGSGQVGVGNPLNSGKD